MVGVGSNPTGVSVRQWPSYLLRGIPPDLWHRLIEESVARDLSLNDVVRQALCRRYKLNCDTTGRVAGRYAGGDVLLLRLQPELYKLIKKETANEYGAVRALILDTLTQDLERNE